MVGCSKYQGICKLAWNSLEDRQGFGKRHGSWLFLLDGQSRWGCSGKVSVLRLSYTQKNGGKLKRNLDKGGTYRVVSYGHPKELGFGVRAGTAD